MAEPGMCLPIRVFSGSKAAPNAPGRCSMPCCTLHAQGADDEDWVLVHDAARPNLARDDLDKLLSELADDPVGGLLAVPARDTLKRVDKHGRVLETVDRSVIWQAYTPQMFRLGALHRALADSLVADVVVTDEASAMEWSGPGAAPD